MQREIKFRAWDGEEMIPVTELHFDDDGILKSTLILYKIMQFTGLLDKSGKEIYESDKLKDLAGDIGIVEFDSGSFIIRHKNGTSDFIAKVNHFEIVGNTYED